MDVIGTRAKSLPAPPHVVRQSLLDPHAPGARPWLVLLDDEVEPRVLEAGPALVVWSSLWPRRPDDRVRFDLGPDQSCGTRLRWTLETPDPLPDESRTGHLRHRLNHLLFADLRLSYGQ